MDFDWLKNIWKNLSKKYSLIIYDPKRLKEVVQYRFSIGNLIIFLTVIWAVFTLGTIYVSTQTFFLNYLGAKPKNIMSQSFNLLEKKVDSLEILAFSRDEYFQKIQKLISVQVPKEIFENGEKLSDKDVETKMTVSLPNLILGPMEVLSCPVKGIVTRNFSEDKYHYGVDIAAKEGCFIQAVLDGFISRIETTKEGGLTIEMIHSGGTRSVFKHNSAIISSVFDFMSKGEPIAIIGNTGEYSSGTHLHFEIWNENKPIDPMQFMNCK